MKRFITIFAAALSGLFLSAASAAAQGPELNLQAILDNAQTNNKVIGMGAIVMHSDGSYVIAVSGERVVNSHDLIREDDHWHIGSNTKSITALLYGRLVEAGLASWDATIPELFPNLSGEIDLTWETLAVEDLFAHRAGLGQLGRTWLRDRHRDVRPLPEQRMETARTILQAAPNHTVGNYRYANLGYIIAGAAIEQILSEERGQQVSWEDALQEFVFDELSDPADQAAWGTGPPQNGIQGHRSPFGLGFAYSAMGLDKNADNPLALGPAGTLHTSLKAHAALSREYLSDDSTLIPQSLREKLLSPYPYPEADYAMGWGVYDRANAGRYYGHGGSNTMWLSDVRIVPEFDIVVIVNSNHLNGRVENAHQDVLTAVFNHYETKQLLEED